MRFKILKNAHLRKLIKCSPLKFYAPAIGHHTFGGFMNLFQDSEDRENIAIMRDNQFRWIPINYEGNNLYNDCISFANGGCGMRTVVDVTKDIKDDHFSFVRQYGTM